MSHSRRSFIKNSAIAATSLSLVRLVAEGLEQNPAAPAANKGKGLLFDPEDLPRIRANLTLPRFSVLSASILGMDHVAEQNFLRHEVRLNNHITDFSRVCHTLEFSAFAFAVTGNRQAMATSLLALERLRDYKRWDYFLEGGKDTIGIQRASDATIASCFALDWLGPEITDSQRLEAEHQIATKGAPACYLMLYGLKYPDRVRGWTLDPEEDYPVKLDMDLRRWPLILNATNLKIIPTSALGIAAAWLHGRHPEADKWLQMSRQSAQSFATMYGLDGAYDEGVGYWGYTTSHLALVADVLFRRLGLDDRKLINYPGTIRYALTLSMPCGGIKVEDPKLNSTYNAVPKGDYDPALDIVNFSDSGLGLDVSSAPWVGQVASDPLSNFVAKNAGEMKQYPALVWYRDEVETRPPGPELHDVRLSNDWVVSRTGWRPEDGVVAFRSGGPSNHEHADRNSVIFKAYGERLFHDPFRAAYVPSNPRWLLRQTAAHTAVLIGGQGHQYHDGHEGTNSSLAFAHVTEYRTGPNWMTVTSDATDAYSLVLPDVILVTRTLVFLKPDMLILFDRVRLKNPALVQLRFQAFNEDARAKVTVGKNQFGIARPLASVAATVGADNSFNIQTGKLNLPESEGVFPYVEIVSAAGNDHTILTACTAAPAGEAHGELHLAREGRGWRVTGNHRHRTVQASITLSPTGEPVVEVQP
jgi:hypothetical protein